MGQNTVGILLRYYRDTYQLQQYEICKGICSCATLSRVEQGKREIDSLICETLLSRIGKEASQFEIMLDEEDYIKWKMRDKIKKLIKIGNIYELREAINEYEEIAEKDSSVHQQFILYAKIQALQIEQKVPEEICLMIDRAIRYTIEPGEKRRLYSHMEIELIQQKIHYTVKKNYEEERKIINFLLEQVTAYYGKKEKNWLKIILLKELQNIEIKEGNDLKVLECLNNQIAVVREMKTVFPLANLYFERARWTNKVYQSTEAWTKWKNNCVKDCLMAYYIYQIENDSKKEEQVEKYCTEVLGWHIIKQEI